MALKDYIERGAKKCGAAKMLAERLGIAPTVISDAKRHQRGLPNFACVMLADFIGEPRINVIAASELVTEKDPVKRAVWEPFVQGTALSAADAVPKKNATAAQKAMTASIVALTLTSGVCSFPETAQANDTLFVSTASESRVNIGSQSRNVHELQIMRNRGHAKKQSKSRTGDCK